LRVAEGLASIAIVANGPCLSWVGCRALSA
jgi:hypothetical protein